MREWWGVRKTWFVVALAAALALGGVGVGAAQGDGLIDMEFDGARLADVLRVLAELEGYNVIVDPGVEGRITMRLHGMTVDEALEMVIRTGGYDYRKMGNTLVVGDEATLRARFDVMQSKLLTLEHAAPQDLLPVLRLLVPELQAEADVSRRALVVRGTEKEVAEAERLVKERDVRPPVNEEFVDQDVVEIFRALARLGGYNLVAEGDVAGRITVALRSLTVEQAVDLVARRTGFDYEFDGVDLYVTGAAPAGDEQEGGPLTGLRGARERRVLQLIYVAPDKLVEAVEALVAGGDVWSDAASRTMIVDATASELRQIEELVRMLDAPRLALRGVLRRDDAYVAILQIEEDNFIVQEGHRVRGVTVVEIDAVGVTVETDHGRTIRVATGGSSE